MHEHAPRWVVVGLIGLAVPQIITGIWGVVTPEEWFRSFPGFGPRFVSGHPPFNHHLAGDAAAGFLATGVGLGLAAASGHRRTVQLACLVYLTFSIPHFLYHAFHPAPVLSGRGDLLNLLLQAAGVVAASCLLWGVHVQRGSASRSTAAPADSSDNRPATVGSVP
jgi:hypothetical protein